MSSTWLEPAESQMRADAAAFRVLSDAHILTAICLKYLLYDGELSPTDFSERFTDGPNDGGIDAVAIYDQDGFERIALVQSKRTAAISKNDVLEIAHKIVHTLGDFQDGYAARYSNKLRHSYESALTRTDNAPQDILICTTAQPTPSAVAAIRSIVREDPMLADCTVELCFRDDIENAIESVDQPEDFVSEDHLDWDISSGRLEYTMQGEGSPKGLFLNVTASSINRLFSLHGDRGLFAQNLRQFIRNKKVDDAISDTISNEPDSFWLKNNGLTVACSDCRFDGRRLVLYEFSIINGCQTATKIGKSVLPNGSDFLVPCKVIRETNKATMAAFAEAANSQKAIQDRDLKANAPEQTRLKMRFLNSSPPIYISIKRGVKQFTRAQRVSRDIRDWRQLDNKLYGQLVLAFHCQKPHISFAQAGKIFGSRETYKEVFLRSQDLATEKDLLRLHDAFLSWRESKFSRVRFVIAGGHPHTWPVCLTS